MFFKVDYDKVAETSNFLMSKTEELNKLYLEIIDICKLIENNWQSEDSSVYVLNFANFVKGIMKENEKLYDAGKVLSNISCIYMEQDSKWATDLINNDIERKS